MLTATRSAFTRNILIPVCVVSIWSTASASAQSGAVPEAVELSETQSSPAPPPTSLPASTTEGSEHWYGQPILVIGFASFALMGLPFVVDWTSSDANTVAPFAVLGVIALGVGIFDGPIVHWSHGNVGKGFGSLGLHVALGLVGAGLGASACGTDGCGASSSAGNGALYGVLIGVSIGTLAAVVVDALWLAYEPAVADRAASRSAQSAQPALSVTPDIVIARDGTTFVTLRGAF